MPPWFSLAALRKERSLDAVDVGRDPHPPAFCGTFTFSSQPLGMCHLYCSSRQFQLCRISHQKPPHSDLTFLSTTTSQFWTFFRKAASENAKLSRVFVRFAENIRSSFFWAAHFLTMRGVSNKSFCVSSRNVAPNTRDSVDAQFLTICGV